MPVKKHSVEHIVAKMREIEKLTSQGIPIPMAAKKVGVSDQTAWSLFVAQPSVRTPKHFPAYLREFERAVQ